tara:strand:+ start:388 stop:2532 length:2145 start_codon:yes stop_codon:yes gene_type:complete
MKKTFILLFILISSFSFSQEKVYDLFETQEVITVDGVLDEHIWERFPIATDFTQNYPTDTLLASSNTKVKMCYNDKFLYVSAVCYNNGNTNYVVNSFIRDFSFPRTDAFAIFLSPLQDKTNGLSFSVNPYNVQRDGLVSSAGAFGVTTSWNQKWYSEVKQYGNYWTLEMAIPLNILNYKKTSTTWDMNFARNDLKVNETSTWTKVPLGRNVASVNFYGKLVWKDELPKPKPNISIVPYLSAGGIAHFENNKFKDQKNLSNIGLDAKIGVTNTLNLDVSINPDFSNTEVDEQVINLERFSIFLPEKRLFFTENSDLFAGFGFSKIRPFNSRRIGLDTDIIGGLRLSGNLTKKMRMGVMNIQTQGTADARQLKSQNYAVVAVKQNILGNSSIGGIFVNKQAFNGFSALEDQRNTMAGIDFNYYSKNNKWKGKAFYHQGFNQKFGITNSANAIWLNFNDTRWNVSYNHEYVGEGYDAEVGFVPRKGYFRFEHTFGRSFYYKKGKINYQKISTYYSQYWEKGAVSTDRYNSLYYKVQMNNSSYFGAKLVNQQTRLENPFDVVNKGTPIESGNYLYSSGEIFYYSDYRKAFTYSGKVNFGQFYKGNKLTMNATLDYRFRPKATVGLNFTRNEIRFPEGQQDGFITLIGAQFKISFNKNMHWATFVQYNTQADNFNINSRIQWRVAPMSDIFLTYTDNYDIVFNQKNKAIVLRFNYWFGL